MHSVEHRTVADAECREAESREQMKFDVDAECQVSRIRVHRVSVEVCTVGEESKTQSVVTLTVTMLIKL